MSHLKSNLWLKLQLGLKRNKMDNKPTINIMYHGKGIARETPAGVTVSVSGILLKN